MESLIETEQKIEKYFNKKMIELDFAQWRTLSKFPNLLTEDFIVKYFPKFIVITLVQKYHFSKELIRRIFDEYGYENIADDRVRSFFRYADVPGDIIYNYRNKHPILTTGPTLTKQNQKNLLKYRHSINEISDEEFFKAILIIEIEK